MQYLLLIYEAEEIWENKTDEEKKTIIARHMTLQDRLNVDGGPWVGQALMPTSTALSVTLRGGKRQVSDGPFAETKEQLAGFYLVEAQSMEQAVEYAALIPSVDVGTIEVRPIADHSEHAT